MSGEPGRTRTSNPLIASRNAKYSMFQAVSWFRECQKWAVLGVVVTKDVTKINSGSEITNNNGIAPNEIAGSFKSLATICRQ